MAHLSSDSPSDISSFQCGSHERPSDGQGNGLFLVPTGQISGVVDVWDEQCAEPGLGSGVGAGWPSSSSCCCTDSSAHWPAHGTAGPELHLPLLPVFIRSRRSASGLLLPPAFQSKLFYGGGVQGSRRGLNISTTVRQNLYLKTRQITFDLLQTNSSMAGSPRPVSWPSPGSLGCAGWKEPLSLPHRRWGRGSVSSLLRLCVAPPVWGTDRLLSC